MASVCNFKNSVFGAGLARKYILWHYTHGSWVDTLNLRCSLCGVFVVNKGSQRIL